MDTRNVVASAGSRSESGTRRARVALVAIAAIGGSLPLQAQTGAPSNIRPKIDCTVMANRSIAAAQIGLPTRGATVVSAELKPAAGDSGSPDFVPEHCSMTGVITSVDPAAPPINFRVNVPTLWNQKSWHMGGQGMNGTIPGNLATVARDGLPGFTPGSPLHAAYPPDAPFPIAQGYALYGSDSGHQNAPQPARGAVPAGRGAAAPGSDRGGPGPAAGSGRGNGQPPAGRGAAPGAGFAWMQNDEAWTNFGGASIKKTHDVAMQILAQMYGAPARVKYFGGQSQGGREALVAVSRYPDDYDGVLAAGPLVYFMGLWLENRARFEGQLTAAAYVPATKRAAIGAEVLRQCDQLDGLTDGVVNNYQDCNRRFDPTQTPNPFAALLCAGGSDTADTCLSQQQLATISSWHAPAKLPFPLANGETEYPGWPTGAEGSRAGGWLTSATPPDPNMANGAIWAGPVRMRLGNPADFDIRTKPIAELRSVIQEMSKTIDPGADWSKFLASNGKLIYYTPGSDYVTSARAQARLYEEAVKRSGQGAVDRGVRYYVSPGTDHAGRGADAKDVPLPRYVDLVTHLQNWVEKGTPPPDPIVQTFKEPKAPYTVVRSRPLCRYPQYPRYQGSGDPNAAASYACAAPSRVNPGN